LATLTMGVNAVLGLAVAAPGAVYLLKPGKSAVTPWTRVGSVAALTVDRPEELTYERVRRDGWRFVREKATAWVVKGGDGAITALHPACTHLGCAYHYEEAKRQFSCPCHASAFRTNGDVISGPAPRALDRYVTKIENGELFVGPVESEKEA
jgi:menaquinol-cytochrome c reductase iron-sulfur subunit